MKKIKVKAYAKINLSLDVLGKRKDGYHEISTVMQSIDLADILEFEKSEIVKVFCSGHRVPEGEDNLIVKVINFLKEKYQIEEGVLVRLDKKIPLAAGLAGGSADAAATIVALDKLWNLNMSADEKKEIALKVGADVPFCLEGGTKLAKGIGEIFEDLNVPHMNLLLVKPDIEIFTKKIYDKWDRLNFKSHHATCSVVQAIQEGNIYKIAENIKNDLELVTSRECEVINQIKEELLKKGALGCAMSGSGPTVYGIFDDLQKLIKAYKDLEGIYSFVFFSKTIDKGLELYE
ncbi:4-diphosphocytidyl-2C-methyl-D-erythritol kinase [Thermoanaerobacter mathranii subsp. mathranii str. A3]|jgi:4-diphosphocytidyl-2-C-methyl-D-erythritol kinase|uniref:4-diphosphocytidyl-2-C-methyl-D-erythritol kinase n=2 Tax=Thermoanaerobacter TaxID=1754 RepID=D3T5R5_THEIA|nr:MULTISPECIES: 4-(cytidine 5'-diphospho)-2-C-methyl-D-erythritol kinase [Thermoanaerobacter]ADD03438.1 4-diphosphocytidyl-2C-methyl-D-erythritol kinase [Thermoanaerobacter italicus Ab9]ADH61805.1 4-diphosphocytidyl-2C-methyl-D-erythritol kinase [Thermoanaerobacter mathranii subsp. mathranii str. A3]MDK2815202.1 4-diphosphocytidyl-2-C-methyl-D-erythritol kinase [Thermoanaerobacter sp.]